MQLMWRRPERFLLRLEIKSREFFETATKKTAPLLLLIYWLCFTVSLPVCVYCMLHLPPAGVAIGALGAAGVLVALRGEETPKGHRFLWAVVTLLLLVVEVKAINEDRSSQFLAHLHDLELQRAGQAQTLLHITLTNQAVMSQNQLQFEKTLSEVSGVADSARKQIRLSNEAISQVTGGDDFGYVLYDAFLDTLPRQN